MFGGRNCGVKASEFRAWAGQYTVDHEFEEGQICSGGADIIIVDSDVASSDSDARAVVVQLLWADFANHADISNISLTLRWDVTEADHSESVCSCNALLFCTFVATPDTLAETSHFVCVGPFPDVFEFWVATEFAVFHRLA